MRAVMKSRLREDLIRRLVPGRGWTILALTGIGILFTVVFLRLVTQIQEIEDANEVLEMAKEGVKDTMGLRVFATSLGVVGMYFLAQAFIMPVGLEILRSRIWMFAADPKGASGIIRTYAQMKAESDRINALTGDEKNEAKTLRSLRKQRMWDYLLVTLSAGPLERARSSELERDIERMGDPI